MRPPLRLGIDLGGTKTEIAALDASGALRLRRRVPSPRGDYAATVAAIVALVADAERELGRRGTVGVGIPGTISALTGRVKNANSTWLNGRPLREDLEAALGPRFRLDNSVGFAANITAINKIRAASPSGAGSSFCARAGPETVKVMAPATSRATAKNLFISVSNAARTICR